MHMVRRTVRTSYKPGREWLCRYYPDCPMSRPTSNLKRAHSADDAPSSKKRRTPLWECGEYCTTVLEVRGPRDVVETHLHDLTEREFTIISKLHGTDAGSRVTIKGQKVDAQSVLEFLEMEPSAVLGTDVPEAFKLLRDLMRPGLLPAVRGQNKPDNGLQIPAFCIHRKAGHVGLVVIYANGIVKE